MADVLQAPPTAAEHFAGDYVHTFARLLDPGLAARAGTPAERDATKWPLGQSVAFATIVSAGLWACVATVVYFFA